MFSGIEFDAGRRFRREAIDFVGTRAREQAVRGLVQTKITSGDYPILIDAMSVGYILGAAVGGGLNAESIQRNRSYLSGRLGERVGSELLSVSDDPTVEWAQGSYSFDGEGSPARSKVLFDRGRVTSYLHDSYTAGKDSVRSTGNSSRGGAIWSFRHPPEIAPSNLVVKAGDHSFEEMVRETRDGIYLRLTFDRPNLATGVFSGLMMESYTIDGGELGPSVRQATLGIGLVDMFSRIDMVGKESRDAFGVITPPLRISKGKVAGSG
jgi:PmbA protein